MKNFTGYFPSLLSLCDANKLISFLDVTQHYTNTFS